jgi:hypothetical protein
MIPLLSLDGPVNAIGACIGARAESGKRGLDHLRDLRFVGRGDVTADGPAT